MDAERRQVVILFADMVGYTAFSERFGEEAAFGLIQTLTLILDRAVQAEGARLQSHLGDGVVVAFGAPAAMEDAPLRACRAALSILGSLKSSAEEIEEKHRIRPQLRIGIHAGPAVFGEIQSGGEVGTAVLGDTVNLAARLQSIAEPGTVVLSEPTLRLVEGQVEATFVGEQPIKGRSAPEKIYRLDAIRENPSRFAATLSRGLTSFVGRDSELETLGRGLDSIGAGIRVIDIVGDPGIGKSRLLHEFLQQVVQRRAWTLTGHCTHDGRQTPYRAFIDIVRGVAGIAPSGDGPSIRGKLGESLQALGLGAEENLDLLVNLLGHEAGPGALAGLDGVLIGLRTREVLRLIVQARARLAPLILAFEDVHWLDSASEALLASLIAIGAALPLLIVHTRRPVYQPPWTRDARVTPIALDPLPARETLRIAQSRLGVERLPEALAKLIVERAEGNALFAEEIVSFLVERGVVSRGAAGVRFDPALVTAALPHSVQSILASRIDQLSREARGLLQMAAVVGRRFDPRLVLALTGGTSRAESSFATMEALDLIHRDEPSGDYLFKHILVRDALYDGLLGGPREAMHRKVGEELERRSGNAPFERAEALAHHFAAGRNPEKAFEYLAMAARKSLNVYAIPEAEGYFRQALALLDEKPECAEPLAAARVVVGLLETLMLKGNYREAGEIADSFMPLVKKVGDTPELVTACFYQTLSLVQKFELRAAHTLMAEALQAAERLGDGRARAYARAGLFHCRTRLGLDKFEDAERMKAELLDDSLRYGDNFLRNSAYFFVSWDYCYRGLTKDARAIAIRLIATGLENGDPRAIGFANWILGWINLVGGTPEAATAHAEECLRVAIAPFDRLQGELIRAVALVLSGQAREGLKRMEALNEEFDRLGALYNVLEGPRGVALIELGRISEGVGVIERYIAAREASGDRTAAAIARVLLAEVYIQIRAGGRKAPAAVIARNLRTLAGARLFGARRAHALLDTAASHEQLSREGAVIARIDFDRGQLLEMRGKRAKARGCFERARKIAGVQGLDALRRRSEAALARLG